MKNVKHGWIPMDKYKDGDNFLWRVKNYGTIGDEKPLFYMFLPYFEHEKNTYVDLTYCSNVWASSNVEKDAIRYTGIIPERIKLEKPLCPHCRLFLNLYTAFND